MFSLVGRFIRLLITEGGVVGEASLWYPGREGLSDARHTSARDARVSFLRRWQRGRQVPLIGVIQFDIRASNTLPIDPRAACFGNEPHFAPVGFAQDSS